MMVSPFTFYRGAAAIMAYDLAHTPSTGVNVLADGDCHLMNFGAFATAERQVIFDLNDFDEASFAPWEWDVKRLTTSFVVAGRSNGFAPADCREAAWLAAQSYRQRMAEYAGMPVLRVWNDALDFEAIIENASDKEMRRFYAKKLDSATKQSAHEKEFAKLAFSAGDTPRIVDQPPLIFHYGDQRDQEMREIAKKSLLAYRDTLIPARRLLLDRFELVDYAVKVVGVGSVGTFCGVLLLMSGNGDPLFLQFKEGAPVGFRAILRRQPLRSLRPAGGGGPARHASRQRYLPRLDYGCRRPEAPIFPPPAERRQNQAGGGDHERGKPERLCPLMRLGAGASPRSLRRCSGVNRLYGQELYLRRCSG